MAKVQMTLPQELVNYIEGLAHRVAARKDLIAFMIDHGQTESDAFRKYNAEYEDLFAEYDIAKEEMAKTYVTPEYQNCTWNLNFSTGILEVEVTK